MRVNRLCGPAPGSTGLSGTVKQDDWPAGTDPVGNQGGARVPLELNSLHSLGSSRP